MGIRRRDLLQPRTTAHWSRRITQRRFPIVTCSAGPTNSLRGAAFLTGAAGRDRHGHRPGTTTDLGFWCEDFHGETATAHLIGGVRTNFRMPDVLSIALGGGTHVRGGVEQHRTRAGLRVGFQLTRRALVFGGTDPDNDRHCRECRPGIQSAIRAGSRRSTADSLSLPSGPHPWPDRGCDRSDEDQQPPGAGVIAWWAEAISF